MHARFIERHWPRPRGFSACVTSWCPRATRLARNDACTRPLHVRLRLRLRLRLRVLLPPASVGALAFAPCESTLSAAKLACDVRCARAASPARGRVRASAGFEWSSPIAVPARLANREGRGDH
eukprot:2071386-Pleurochrysis_carterae.AAC.1